MEKTSFCSNLRQHSMNSSSSSRNMRQGVSSWDFGGEYSSWGEGDLIGAGFSWPPRSYICSFCKREFRSAQALGGHMNVHRRDRARLRQSPTTNNPISLLNLNLEPNPTFNSNPSSSPPPFLTKFPQFAPKLPPLGPLPDDITPDSIKPKAAKALFGVQKFHLSVNEKRCEDFKRSESVRLDLEIGLISESEEELDLELRLGYT